jgi:ABC-type transporter Mla MlaB component
LGLVDGLPLSKQQKKPHMFRLSTVDTNGQRKLVLEGKLVRPWTEEVESAWRRAQEHLQGRQLVVDLTNLTLIDPEGETTLLNLMRDGARFTCGGVLTKHLLKQLARRCRSEP